MVMKYLRGIAAQFWGLKAWSGILVALVRPLWSLARWQEHVEQRPPRPNREPERPAIGVSL